MGATVQRSLCRVAPNAEVLAADRKHLPLQGATDGDESWLQGQPSLFSFRNSVSLRKTVGERPVSRRKKREK